ITFSISDMQLEDVLLLFIHIPLSYTLTINLCESLKIVHFSYFYSIIFMRLINMDQWLIYLIIIVVLLFISLIVVKLMKKDFNLEANKLLVCLGGKDNIVNAECNMSRFKVILKDVSKVDKDGI